VRMLCAYAGLTSEALSTTFSLGGISCGRLVFLAHQIGRGLRRTMYMVALTPRYHRTMCHCWYSLSWCRAVVRVSVVDSLHRCRPMSWYWHDFSSVRVVLVDVWNAPASGGAVDIDGIRVVSRVFTVLTVAFDCHRWRDHELVAEV